MTEAETTQIRALVTDALGIGEGELDPDRQLTDLEGWDSLRQLNVMMAVEETFGVTMEPEDLQRMTSLADIADIIDERREP
jgi:acyl carrier protein